MRLMEEKLCLPLSITTQRYEYHYDVTVNLINNRLQRILRCSVFVNFTRLIQISSYRLATYHNEINLSVCYLEKSVQIQVCYQNASCCAFVDKKT